MPLVMEASGRPRYRPLASRVSVLAHLMGVTAIVLMLVWLLHFRGGLGHLDSDNKDRLFNLHPFFMFIGFIFVAGEGMMAYVTIGAEKRVQKFLHMVLHLIALTMAFVGIYAVFKYHKDLNIPDMYSLHSWLGIGTFCLFVLQWLVGFLYFLFPKASGERRARLLPWHVFGGRALLYMAICTAESGLMEKASFMKLQHGIESRLINFTGIFILLFGLAVDLLVTTQF